MGYTTHAYNYIGSFVYKDGLLRAILTVEGRVVVDGSSYEYQYFLKDHLGNTRVTFNESGTVIQVGAKRRSRKRNEVEQCGKDSYYPFGMLERSGNPATAGAGLSHCSGEDLPNKYLYNA